ncbi:MAG TPA: replication-relaxation family protein [Solirubrobacteraceae bacterium]|jgi:hypothetical protein|nr:replication-relaxation family protein [Solirubrobacteraceae bacterium]
MKDLHSPEGRPPHLPALDDLDLSRRDHHVISLVDRFRTMSGAQLRELCWPEGPPETRARLARRRLAKLATKGLLEPLERRVGGVRAGSAGYCFSLGAEAQRRLRSGRARRPVAPGARHLAHTLAVAQLFTDLTLTERWGVTALLAFDPEPECWRYYPGLYGVTESLRPDAFVRLAHGEYEDSWLVEIDRATVGGRTLAAKAQRYVDCFQSGAVQASEEIFPKTLWIVPNGHRAKTLAAILGDLPREHRRLFEVVTADKAVGLLASGEPS